jgi:hypothetical protein
MTGEVVIPRPWASCDADCVERIDELFRVAAPSFVLRQRAAKGRRVERFVLKALPDGRIKQSVGDNALYLGNPNSSDLGMAKIIDGSQRHAFVTHQLKNPPTAGYNCELVVALNFMPTDDSRLLSALSITA